MFAVAKQEMSEFLNETSIHGVKFISSRHSRFERTLWLLVCSAAFIGVVLNTGIILATFQNSPAQTIVEDTSFPAWNVDFPALTICNLNKVQLSRARKLMTRVLGKNVDNATEHVFLDSLLALSMMRFPYYHHPNMFIRHYKKKTMDFQRQNISDMMLTVMARQDEVFGTCYWKGREIPCSSLFRLQVTEEGYCYSFNSKTSEPPKEVDMDSPPFVDRSGKQYVWRNNAAGTTTGLEVFFRSPDEEYLPNDPRVPGFNLIVHHPSELPDISRGLFLTRSTKLVTHFAVTASRVKAGNELARFSLKKRGCFIPEDLRTEEIKFPFQSFCKTSCRLVTMAARCQCVPYFAYYRMRHLYKHTANVTVCSAQHVGCLAAQNAQLRNIRPPEGSTGFRKSDIQNSNDCECPASCSSTSYDVKFFMVSRIDPFQSMDYAYLDFYLKESEIVSYSRDIKFGDMDLLVSFGGVAGLFLGFSLISAVEIIYFTCRTLARMLTSNSSESLVKQSSNPPVDVSTKIFENYVLKAPGQGKNSPPELGKTRIHIARNTTTHRVNITRQMTSVASNETRVTKMGCRQTYLP